jgi:hypothetical protein
MEEGDLKKHLGRAMGHGGQVSVLVSDRAHLLEREMREILKGVALNNAQDRPGLKPQMALKSGARPVLGRGTAALQQSGKVARKCHEIHVNVLRALHSNTRNQQKERVYG